MHDTSAEDNMCDSFTEDNIYSSDCVTCVLQDTGRMLTKQMLPGRVCTWQGVHNPRRMLWWRQSLNIKDVRDKTLQGLHNSDCTRRCISMLDNPCLAHKLPQRLSGEWFCLLCRPATSYTQQKITDQTIFVATQDHSALTFVVQHSLNRTTPFTFNTST